MLLTSTFSPCEEGINDLTQVTLLGHGTSQQNHALNEYQSEKQGTLKIHQI